MSYKLTHPDGGEVEANVDQVAMYESQGWETSSKAKPPAPSSAEGDDKKK